mgnify:CR=1 FL=1
MHRGLRCGLLGWCSGAKKLQAVLPSTWSIDLLAVHADTTHERCVRPQFLSREAFCCRLMGKSSLAVIGQVHDEGPLLDPADVPTLEVAKGER